MLIGTPRVGASALVGDGRIAVGQTLTTDAGSRATMEVSDIGQVTVDEAHARPPGRNARRPSSARARSRHAARRHHRAARPVRRQHAVGDGDRSRLHLLAARERRRLGTAERGGGLGGVRGARARVVRAGRRVVAHRSRQRAGNAAVRRHGAGVSRCGGRGRQRTRCRHEGRVAALRSRPRARPRRDDAVAPDFTRRPRRSRRRRRRAGRTCADAAASRATRSCASIARRSISGGTRSASTRRPGGASGRVRRIAPRGPRIKETARLTIYLSRSTQPVSRDRSERARLVERLRRHLHRRAGGTSQIATWPRYTITFDIQTREGVKVGGYAARIHDATISTGDGFVYLPGPGRCVGTEATSARSSEPARMETGSTHRKAWSAAINARLP